MENNNAILNEKINDLVDKKEDTDLMTEDDCPSIFDLFEKRMNDLELRLARSEAKNKKMTTVINRLAKASQN